MQQSASERLLAILDAGQTAQRRDTVIRGNDTVLKVPNASPIAGVADILPLSASVTELLGKDGRVYEDPSFKNAGASLTLKAAAAKSSRVISAGASLISDDHLEKLIPVPGGVGVDKQAVSFTTLNAASFDKVDFEANPDAEVAVSDLPISVSELDRDALISRAVAFRLSRRQLKTMGKSNKQMAMELVWPIIQGLGRAIDQTLFEAINALPASSWALGKAAEQGFPFDALRAIVGTHATSFHANASEGALYVEGVPAELTPDMTNTLIGVWSRAAIVVDPNINLIVSRTDASGGVEVVCWVDMQALLPDPAVFWLVD